MRNDQLLRFDGSRRRDPAITRWMQVRNNALGAIAARWFEVMRNCGDDVLEVLHDGHPTVCVDGAGFAYVNLFTAHVNVGFFRGAELHDPAALLQGAGKYMRHVKIQPGMHLDEAALSRLITAAYIDIKRRLDAGH